MHTVEMGQTSCNFLEYVLDYWELEAFWIFCANDIHNVAYHAAFSIVQISFVF